MVPLIKDRKAKINHIEGLKTFTEFYYIPEPEFKFSNIYNFHNQTWIKRDFGFSYLSENPFFK